MQSLISITNIPTPYRIHFYRSLSNALSEVGVHHEVWFMASTEPGRNWHLEPTAFGFPNRVYKGIHPIIQNRQFHFNPSLILDLYKQKPTWALFSGSWFFPSVFLGMLAAKQSNTKTIIWNESNLRYVEHNGEVAGLFRKLVLDNYDSYAVPGIWAEEYVRKFAPSSSSKPILSLPNVVNESIFVGEVQEKRLHKRDLRSSMGVSNDATVLITPSRIEPIKGIAEMVNGCLEYGLPRDYIWVIAGDGTQLSELRSNVKTKGLEDSIKFLGYQSEGKLVELYALSDAFLLPSLGDPYPLAVIEAMFAKLPIFISKNVGCLPEALVEGKNGSSFDPYDSNSIKDLLVKISVLGKKDLQEMGNSAYEIAKRTFSTESVINGFIQNLLAL